MAVPSAGTGRSAGGTSFRIRNSLSLATIGWQAYFWLLDRTRTGASLPTQTETEAQGSHKADIAALAGLWQELVCGKCWFVASAGLWQVLVCGKSWFAALAGLRLLLVCGKSSFVARAREQVTRGPDADSVIVGTR